MGVKNPTSNSEQPKDEAAVSQGMTHEIQMILECKSDCLAGQKRFPAPLCNNVLGLDHRNEDYNSTNYGKNCHLMNARDIMICSFEEKECQYQNA